VREEVLTVEEFIAAGKRLDVVECVITQSGEGQYAIEIKELTSIVCLKQTVDRKTKNEILEALPSSIKVSLEVI